MEMFTPPLHPRRRATINFNKSGGIRFSNRSCEILGINDGSCVIFSRNDRGDWFVREATENDPVDHRLPIRMVSALNSYMTSSAALVRAIHPQGKLKSFTAPLEIEGYCHEDCTDDIYHRIKVEEIESHETSKPSNDKS